MLLSAQAAQLNGDETAARRYFEAMLEKDDTAFLGIRGLLTQALKAGDDAEALRLARRAHRLRPDAAWARSEEHTSDLQSLMRNSSAVFCLKNTITHAPNVIR